MIRACDNCRTGFSANGVWQRLCWTCWREQKDRDDLNVAYVRGYQAGLAAHNLVDADLLQAATAIDALERSGLNAGSSRTRSRRVYSRHERR